MAARQIPFDQLEQQENGEGRTIQSGGREISFDELEQRFQQVDQRRLSQGEEVDSTEEDFISFDQLEQETTIRQSASEIDQLVSERYEKFVNELKEDPAMGRAWSAANRFVGGLTGFAPGALKTTSIVATGFWNSLTGDSIDPTETGLFEAGQRVGEALEETFPDNPLFRDEFWAGTMAQAGGQMTGNVIAALASGGVAGLGKLGVFGSVAALNSTLGSQYFEEAKAAGANDDTAFQSTLLNMGGSAALEALPMALMISRLNKATGGGITKLLKAGFRGSMEEGITEGLQQFYSNLVASTFYDEHRKLMEGVPEGFAAGAILGGFVNASLTGLINQGARAESPEKRAAVEESIDHLYETFPDQLSDVPRNDVDSFLQGVEGEQKPKQVAESTTVTETNNLGEPNSVLDPAARSQWQKWKNKWLDWFPLEKRVGEIQSHEKAWADAEFKIAELNLTRVNRELLKYVGSDKKNVAKAVRDGEISPELIQQIDEAYRNPEALAKLPEGVRQAVNDVRKHIDRLSIEFVKRGYVQGDLTAKFMENLGSYIHRKYKIFDPNVEWGIDNIPTDVWNSALSFMRGKLRTEAQQSGQEISGEAIERQAERKLKQILDAEGTGSIRRLFKTEAEKLAIDKGDRDVLLAKQDIPKPIRDLMGEVTDPALNYINTIEKMANTLSKRQMFDTIASEFEGTLFLTNDQRLGRSDFTQWKKLDSGVRSKLDRMYMHEDMLEQMTHESRTENQMAWLTGLYRMNLASKYAKTVLSHVTVVRNVTGGTMFMGFNGLMFNIRNFAPAYESAKQAFYSLPQLDKQGLAEKNIEYTRLGLEGKSIRFGELKDVQHDARLEADNSMEANFRFLEDITTRGSSVIQKFKRGIGKALNIAGDFYKGGDDFVRIWFYELEKARQQRADPSKTDQDVADIVNDTYQNYDRVGRLAREFRKVPIIGPFVSFPAEIVRTSANSAKQAQIEISSDNAEVRKIGYQRITGMLTTTLGVIGLGAASQAVNRITDDEDQAYREFMPPWDQNSIVAYTEVGRGLVRYINTSYTNPYAYLVDPIFSLFKGADDQTVLENFANGLSVAFEPILGEEIFAQALREVLTNARTGGGEVYNPQDNLGDKMQKSLLHMYKALEPGSLTSVKRAITSLVDGEQKGKATDELLGLFGLRMITVDVVESFGFSIRDQRQAIRDIRRGYNSVKFREGSGRQEIREAYTNANEQHERVFRRMMNIVDAAQQTGVRWRELKEIMEDSGLSQRDINAVRSGRFEPFDR